MKKKLIILAIVLFSIALIGIGTIYFIFFASNTNNTKQEQVIVPRNATLSDLMDALDDKDIIKNESTFGITVKAMRFQTIRCGKYTIEPKMSNFKLVRLLRAGQHYPVTFSFNNIRTMKQFVEKTNGKFFFDSKELALYLMDSSFLKKYGVNHATCPAIFIPNSYEIYYDVSVEDFIDKLYGYYKQFWNAERLALADSIGLTPTEVSTLASIVEEENFRPAEKAIIAGLYINRLHKGMLLQSDPTVKFAIQDFTRQRILNSDLKIDSPYNTYKYKGLPPGPIRIPEASTIDSVLHYRHHNYLYMCAKEDLSGYHNFTASAAEHSRNAARYRAALNKKNIKK